ncbi:ribbon-helix-helix protein, CopG family [Ekhidna sp.]|uniref:ribbon-helix-helix protein, CopG family n=1 Tax=Ekhidna sp. TaxID=2608089 RepID=UPI0032ECAF50
MATFTSSLPDDLLKNLGEKAKELSMPKNKIMERAIRIYLDQLNRAEYAKSYKSMGDDDDIMGIAEEGMEDYLKQIVDESG